MKHLDAFAATAFCIVLAIGDARGWFRPAIYKVRFKGVVGGRELWNYEASNTSTVVYVEWTFTNIVCPKCTIKETTVQDFQQPANPFEPNW